MSSQTTHPGPATMRANRKIAETHCVLCEKGFELAEDVYFCAPCAGHHHVGCGHPAEPAEEPDRAVAPAIGADERYCPHCGQAIKREALKCRFCEKTVDSRLQAREVNARQIEPPKMPWFLILVLNLFSYGFFGLIWWVRQSIWAIKAAPGNRSTLFLSLGIVALFIGGIASTTPGASGVGGLFTLGGIVLVQVGNFAIRSAMVEYYNTVEPVGLTLSGFMSLFFGSVYYQYHFSRIANEKKQALTTLGLSQRGESSE